MTPEEAQKAILEKLAAARALLLEARAIADANNTGFSFPLEDGTLEYDQLGDYARESIESYEKALAMTPAERLAAGIDEDEFETLAGEAAYYRDKSRWTPGGAWYSSNC